MSHSNAVHHVVKDGFKSGQKSLCGRVVWSYNMPLTIQHAQECIAIGTRVTPCKKCMFAHNKIGDI